MMPFDAAAIWVSGVSGYIDDRGKFHGVVIFNLESDKGESSIDDSVLSAMGYKFSMVTDSVRNTPTGVGKTGRRPGVLAIR